MKYYGFYTRALLCFVILIGCKVRVTSGKSRIYVIQEIKLGDNASFFWFRNEQQITHQGLSYFQIAKNRCELSIADANAFCQLPEHILNVTKDTVFILSKSEIELIKKPERYFIKSVGYANNLYDISKKPNKDSMYFLDEVCK